MCAYRDFIEFVKVYTGRNALLEQVVIGHLLGNVDFLGPKRVQHYING